MKTINITLPDGKVFNLETGTLLSHIAEQCNLPFKPVAAIFNGVSVDLSMPVTDDGTLSFIDPASSEGISICRHSAAHIMAQAVKGLYPDTKITIGPATDDGFYYDFDCEHTFTPEDLLKIERRMEEIIRLNQPFIRHLVPREEAIKLFKQLGEDYKIELINDLPDDMVSLYQNGDFIDLCRGPHVPSTGAIKAFKILSVAGAYWRGNEHNKMLQRIYGTAFPNKKALQEYLHFLEESKKRDHRRLGKELDLFSIYEEAGAGLVVYHPRGALIRRILEDFEVREHLRRGYEMVKGPQMLKADLWEKSGHLQHYAENMYFTEVEGTQYGLKPMNCVAHMLIYKSRLHSYRDLPVRYFELGTVDRYEKSGVLHGLTRVREFTQDDAHILCTPQQLHAEIAAIIEFVKDVMNVFEFDFTVELSTRPDKSIGDDLSWERATAALETALNTSGFPYTVNEGDGAFYGPKIDFKLKDCLKRSWQCATIQCDFALPERFDLTYIGEDGNRHRPVMLHRVILGSLERFLGVLIEHYAGAFPVWISPTQVIVLPITEQQHTFSKIIYEKLIEANIRARIDLRNESLNFKIREAQLQKIPFMLIVGAREVEQQSVSLRLRNGQTQPSMSIEGFILHVRETCRLELKHLAPYHITT
ncbi:MAG: threonine--tRNA ligase [Desulfobacterota bacterium]|nr:threonine--tRNA ligase [Thermodesulfobacteriota bacterium]